MSSSAERKVLKYLKSRKIYGFRYLEEMARNEAQLNVNVLCNKGDKYIVRYLLEECGRCPEDLIREARAVRDLIRRHHQTLDVTEQKILEDNRKRKGKSTKEKRK